MMDKKTLAQVNRAIKRSIAATEQRNRKRCFTEKELARLRTIPVTAKQLTDKQGGGGMSTFSTGPTCIKSCCETPDHCKRVMACYHETGRVSPPPDPALALLIEAREWLSTDENAPDDLRALSHRIDAHLAACAHLKERGDV